LRPRVSAWEPNELFYIVQHGIKFTGMPAWPSPQREDEVRAVVAFLIELPKMSEHEYRALVNEPVILMAGLDDAAREAALRCARCHGLDGLGRGAGAFPKLAGQRKEYLAAALWAYAQGKRHSGIMEPLASGLTVERAQALAEHYSHLPRPRLNPSSDDAAEVAAIARGREIALHGIPTQRVPSCADCHGPTGSKRRPVYPILDGQYADYLVLQLELFKQGRRGGSSYAPLMSEVAPRLTKEQIHDVARFYASLEAEVAP
jgi:cytochrome c553